MPRVRDIHRVKKACGIYAITNKLDGKKYIGSAVDIGKRFTSHLNLLKKGNHHSPHLQRAWDKYGEDSFVFGIIEIVSDKNLLIEREQYWIDLYQVHSDKNGYNISPTAGSILGTVMSKETRKKMSIARKGRKFTEEHKAKISAAHKGKKKDPEAVRKMRETQTGKKLSEEHKAKIRASCKGINTYKRTEETKTKISLLKRGINNNKTKLTEIDIPVIRTRLASGEIGTVIAKDYGITKQCIYDIKSGRSWGYI